MRWGAAVVLGVVLGLAALVGGAGGTKTAQACSLSGSIGGDLSYFFQESPVVAIGVLSDASSDRITFTVEEPLQGTAVGSTYTIDNRWPGLGSGCEVYGAGDLGGNRFENGSRVLAGLAREVNGAWQPGYVAQGVMAVDDDELRPLALTPIFPNGNFPWQGVKLDDLRSSVAALAGTPFDAGYEMRGPCNGVPFGLDTMPTYVAGSTLIGIAHVRDRNNGATTLVLDEVLRGDAAPGDVVTMNDHYLRPSATSCRRELADRNPAAPIPTAPFLVFLRPDDYGVAEYRPAGFGPGMLQVNEEWVTGGVATLADFRAAAKAVGAANKPIVTPSSGSGDDTVLSWWWAAGVALVVVAGGAALMWRRR